MMWCYGFTVSVVVGQSKRKYLPLAPSAGQRFNLSCEVCQHLLDKFKLNLARTLMVPQRCSLTMIDDPPVFPLPFP